MPLPPFWLDIFLLAVMLALFGLVSLLKRKNHPAFSKANTVMLWFCCFVLPYFLYGLVSNMMHLASLSHR
jgi:hypothetical protein